MTSHEPDPEQLLGRIYRVLMRRWDSHWYRAGPERAGNAGGEPQAAAQESKPDDQREEEQTK